MYTLKNASPGLLAFLSMGTYEPEQEDALTAGGTPSMVTTPEKFRALIAAQRAEREAANHAGQAGTNAALSVPRRKQTP